MNKLENGKSDVKKDLKKQNIKKRSGKPIEAYGNQQKNHIYVNSKTNLKANIKQCENLINSGCSEVFLHALGKAIPKLANLALRLVNNSNGALTYEANTSTVTLIDEHHPLHDDDELTLAKRLNSCLHIKISTNVDINIDNNI
ncbi:ribonuclease P protein subunit p20-like [Condylostylus longicornis]|uniref:ribonuclease P protein subunit p20-like n=1 Tax=Condylostylus longicornis TaxID=2530218 RepID=UPI00244E3C77|nr:ribonuclease P protein subunit p20-like [Condylostylus longicornis]